MKKHDDKQKNYMVDGMCFGMCAGSIGMSICTIFGQIVFGGVCISVGMLIEMQNLKYVSWQYSNIQIARKYT